MKKLNIQDILRASHVKRWTIVNTANVQTLAQHTFNVVMIARAIARELEHDDTVLIKMALEHDLDEVVTGDIPTPTKQRMLNMGLDSDGIWPHAKKHVGNAYEQKILKMADLIEAYIYIRDNGIGRHAELVLGEVEAAMWDYLRDNFSNHEQSMIAGNVIYAITKGDYII